MVSRVGILRRGFNLAFLKDAGRMPEVREHPVTFLPVTGPHKPTSVRTHTLTERLVFSFKALFSPLDGAIDPHWNCAKLKVIQCGLDTNDPSCHMITIY